MNISNTRTDLHTTIEKTVIQKLQHEWQQTFSKACKTYPFLKHSLHRPVISVSEMKACLGLWITEHNEIRISSTLLQRGRWDSIIEVFLHEVAHQIASAFPHYHMETSHGPLFQYWCKVIGANPGASGNYRSLEDRVWGKDDESDKDDKIMLKVKKLMSLASSANQHEAQAAAAKAGELITRYNIDMIRQDKERGFESIIITEPSLKVSQACSYAASILNRFYFVRVIWIYIYIPEKERWGKALEISGTPTNIKISDYVFHYIIRYAETSWKRYKKENPSCRSRSGYMTGVVSGFMEKLEAQQQQTMDRCQKALPVNYAPVIIEDDRLTGYYENRHPEIVTTNQNYTFTSRSAYNSGKEQGRQLSISKGINDSGGNGGRLIEG